MAFYKVEHSALARALKLLNPSVPILSAWLLSHTLLDSYYDRFISRLQAALSSKKASLITDAWTDISGQSLINYVVICDGNAYFLESVYIGDQLHDAAYLRGEVNHVMEKYEFLQATALVTDNTTTNQAMWRRLAAEHPKKFFYGCACHAVHLLVKDVVTRVKWLDTLQVNCRVLVVFFKSSYAMWSRLCMKLDAEKKKHLAKPGDTRWGSLYSCFESILGAEAILFSTVRLATSSTPKLALSGRSEETSSSW